ncbi:MAG: hypothetical protein KatS3mg068_1511 [Candidatus Sericytochromatia bacterium]|nr:MAG: hypothetical protein KatS3mg068_1511 [Candidatus Sericytochromatia bacterium]
MINIYRVAEDLGLKAKNNGKIYINSDGTQAFFLCPFPHYDKQGNIYFEKTPSFTINLESGKFFCFSCGEKGTSIKELYYKLDKNYNAEAVDCGINYNKNSKNNDLYFKILESMKNKDYDLIIDFLKFRGINVDKGFIDFYKITTIKTEDFYFLCITCNPNVENDELFLFICRKFKYYNGKFETNVSPKYYNIKYKGDFLFPANLDNVKYLYGDYIFLVESIFDSLKLNSMRIKNLCTLGANVKDNFIDFFIGYRYFVRKYVLIPQNDKAGQEWLEQISSSFDKNNIRYSILNLPDGYKDLCEVNNDSVYKLLEDYL